MSDDIFYLDELNEEQKKAAMLRDNAVVSAGAGSGKTKVLSKRFAYLIIERKIKIEKILALTFTKKAANEMYERIYKELQSLAENLNGEKKLLAKTAVDNFNSAHISTLDSFCSTIARSGCRRFGISPDFQVDQNRSTEIARECSLNFFMRHRDDQNIISLISTTRLEDFIASFFEAFLKYVLVTKPIDIEANKKLFEENLHTLIKKNIDAINEYAQVIISFDDSTKSDPLLSPLKEKLLSYKDFSVASYNQADDKFFDMLCYFSKINLRSGSRKEEFIPARNAASAIRDTGNALLSLRNTFVNRDLIFALFDLLRDLQQEFIAQKISESILSYADVSQLAVDSLLQDNDLRQFYKNEFDSIMIDEFQDNNKLQRNLLFLISEKKDLHSTDIPSADQLSSDKLFFVGDDKQSIYLFRGANVSVFKKLHDEFSKNKTANLDINYRTEDALIQFFNLIFKNIFIDKKKYDDLKLSDTDKKFLEHEANFSKIHSFRKTKHVYPSVNLFVACNNLNDGDMYLNAHDAESYMIAQQISQMIRDKVCVRAKDKDGNEVARPCRYSDFAILFRVTTHQSSVEKFLRLSDIPYKTVQQKGIFTDAPINDMIALIRLALHPDDSFTYAQILRSPFSKLDDTEIAQVLLQDNLSDPFVVTVNGFKTATLDKLDALRELFLRVAQYTKENTCAEIISKLWYDEGYRYVILHNKNYHRYLELYDYLFEIARQCDTAHNSLEVFLQQIESYMQQENKLDDMEIPISLDDDDDCVKLLTVHKSKGLEFPIVCLPFCADTKKSVRLENRVLYSEEDGLSVSIQSDMASGKNENVFFNAAKDFENKKEIAELRRLLYVALTRAESHIILTGIKASRAKDKSNCGFENKEEFYSEIFSSFKSADKSELSFYDLLIAALDEDMIKCTNDVFHIREIIPIEKEKQYMLQKSAVAEEKISTAEKVRRVTHAEKKVFVPGVKKYFTASHLDDSDEKKFFSSADDDSHDTEEKLLQLENVETENISASELGTLTHAAIEARFNKKNIILPEQEREKILLWCDNFFNSELGKLAVKAENLKTEYGIITKYNGKTVIGQIDLLFEHGEMLYIVDYKTDTVENPELHRTQLAVYKEACKNLFGKKADKIKAFLMYLRTGNTVEV